MLHTGLATALKHKDGRCLHKIRGQKKKIFDQT